MFPHGTCAVSARPGSQLDHPVCRLRISLSAAHTTEDVEALAVAIRECGVELPTNSHSCDSTYAYSVEPKVDEDQIPEPVTDALSAQPASAHGTQRPRSHL